MTTEMPLPKPPPPARDAPRDLEALLGLVERQLAALSPQFQQVARYVLANPDETALAPVRVLAGHIGSHPSTVVRFAKQLGFHGFKEMQLVFKSAIYARGGGRNAKVVHLSRELHAAGGQDDATAAVLAHEIESLRLLAADGLAGAIARAAEEIGEARRVWILADLEGLPAGLYLARMLRKLDKDARLLEEGRASDREQLELAEPADVLLWLALDAAEAAGEVAPLPQGGCRQIRIAAGPPPSPPARSPPVLAIRVPSTEGGGMPASSVPMVLARLIVAAVARRAGAGGAIRLTHYADFDPLGW